ncbi:MAG: hypothetical protein KDB03_24295 [Planctomycetales bacterium]|nr:hypothetical protein [Planctomycetales bacterium]
MVAGIGRVDTVHPIANALVRSLMSFLILPLSTAAFGQDQLLPKEVVDTVVVDDNGSLWENLKQKSPWVFLGDSNTHRGEYVAILDAWLAQERNSGRFDCQLINLGVSSETASGLSEQDHPFQRPCVHQRIDKVLTMLRPGVVFACYGMNDGIYDEPSPQRMGAYQAGMLEIARAVRVAGAELIVLTPPPFEPEPVAAKNKLGPSENGRYAYFAPYPQYNLVIEEQSNWILENPMNAVRVVNIFSKLTGERKQRQLDDPEFAFSGDGVHFGSEAHALVAEAILQDLGAPDEILHNYPSAEAIANAIKRMALRRDAYLSATGKNRPGLPAGLPVWLAEKQAAAIP